jgi:hypothetical protein
MPSPPIIYLTPTTLDWNTPDDILLACKGKPIILNGKTLDLNGCTLSGFRLPHPRDKQDETALPLRLRLPGFTLKNGIIRDIPGGIWCRGKAITLSSLTFLEIGEDACSNDMDTSPDWSVLDCTFTGATDKSIQANDGRGLSLRNNTITGGITGVRIQKKATRYKNSTTRLLLNNKFINCQTAWNIAGGIIARAAENSYKNIRKIWVQDSGATYQESTFTAISPR